MSVADVILTSLPKDFAASASHWMAGPPASRTPFADKIRVKQINFTDKILSRNLSAWRMPDGALHVESLADKPSAEFGGARRAVTT